jgi:hypothetical protein
MSEGVAVVAEREREGETGEEIEVLLIEVHGVLRLKTTIHLTAAGDSTTMTEEEGTPLVVVVIATIRSVMVVDGEAMPGVVGAGAHNIHAGHQSPIGGAEGIEVVNKNKKEEDTKLFVVTLFPILNKSTVF